MSQQFSIQEIESSAREILITSKWPSLRELDVEVSDSSLIVRGHVESYYLKQVAQELLREFSDQHEIVNQVLVVKPR